MKILFFHTNSFIYRYLEIPSIRNTLGEAEDDKGSRKKGIFIVARPLRGGGVRA